VVHEGHLLRGFVRRVKVGLVEDEVEAIDKALYAALQLDEFGVVLWDVLIQTMLEVFRVI
jgi:hypothetical protein